MGEIDKMLDETNRQMDQSKKILQELANEVVSLAEVIQPALDKQISALRSARMTTVSEISQSLTVLRDIRRFFLEEAHVQEMERLERFVAVCKELERLKKDGVLDALSDTILRLGVGG
jgi:DNA-binding transcriptional ArsR family regulator